MSRDVSLLKGNHTFGLLYVTVFILSFHLFFVAYINSSFLTTFISERGVGLVYMTGAVLSIVIFLTMPRMLRRFGNYKTLFFFTLLELGSFLGLSFLKNVYLVIPIFIAYTVIFQLLLYNFDVFLEAFTKEEKKTGAIRGIYITIINLALISAPLLSGFILHDGDYRQVYLVSMFILIPFLVLITGYRDFKDPPYHDIQIRNTFACIRANKDIYGIFVSQLIMRFAFAWSTMYLPIYLNAHLGFSWAEIGVIMSIMFLPYVFVEYPAGTLADRFLGERRLLILGFVIAALFTGLMTFVSTPDIIFWTALLFVMRIGLALIEIMTETHFFRHVDATDNNTIGFFRMTHPLSYILGPIVGFIALSLVEFRYIWLILGVILLAGAFYGTQIRDFKLR